MEKLFYLIPKEGVDEAIKILKKERGLQMFKKDAQHLEDRIFQLEQIAKNPVVPVRIEEPKEEITPEEIVDQIPTPTPIPEESTENIKPAPVEEPS